MLNKHNIEVKLLHKCRFCNDEAYQFVENCLHLNKHINNDHANDLNIFYNKIASLELDSNFKCNTCSKAFANIQGLRRHERIHRISKPSSIDCKLIRQSIENRLGVDPIYMIDNSNNVTDNNILLNNELSTTNPAASSGIDITELINYSSIPEGIDDLLNPYTWINDDIIDYYINQVLLNGINREEYVYIPPFITSNFNNICLRSLFSYLQKFKQWKFVYMPLNVTESHWVLGVISKQDNSIKLFDPLMGNMINNYIEDAFQQYSISIHRSDIRIISQTYANMLHQNIVRSYIQPRAF